MGCTCVQLGCNWAATGDPGDLCGPGCPGGRGGPCGPAGPGGPGGPGGLGGLGGPGCQSKPAFNQPVGGLLQ